MREFYKASYSNEMLGDVAFEGFGDGHTWNGWACPYFTHETAENVLKSSEINGYRWYYDKGADSFFVTHNDDPEGFAPEQFEGIRITMKNHDTVVYAIGAYSWTWEIYGRS